MSLVSSNLLPTIAFSLLSRQLRGNVLCHLFVLMLIKPAEVNSNYLHTAIMMLRNLVIAAALCVTTTEGFAFSPSLSVCIVVIFTQLQ